MEIFAALLSKDWILSAVLLGGYLLQHKERLDDKSRYADSLNSYADRLDALAKALTIIQERVK